MTQVKETKSLQYYINPVPQSYVGYKKILIDKLKALTGVDGSPLFSDVYGVMETEPNGSPYCYVVERVGLGKILDTHRNEREWQFSIVIHQVVDKDLPVEKSDIVILDASDRVIKSFDTDPMLLGVHGESRCKSVKVVPMEFEYGNIEQPVQRSLLVVSIVDLVNRYTQ